MGPVGLRLAQMVLFTSLAKAHKMHDHCRAEICPIDTFMSVEAVVYVFVQS